MALATVVVARVADASGQARLEFDYDDVQGQPFATDLVIDEFRVVNSMTRPVRTDLRRSGTGQSWASVTIQPGQTWTRVITGGAVRRESHLADLNLTTV